MSNSGKKKNIGKWIGSIVLALFAIVSFSEAGIISGILFLVCGAFVNPLCQNVLIEKGIRIKKWMSIVGVIVLVFVAILTFPTKNNDDKDAKVVAEETMSEENASEDETMKFETQQEKELAQENEEVKKESISETEAETETMAKKEILKKEAVAESKPVVTEQPQAETEAVAQLQTEAPTQPQPEVQTEAQTQPQPVEQQEPQVQPQTESPQPEAVSARSNSGSGEVVYTGHYYRTKYGECYHYSAECAGKNAYEITESEAMSLKACGNCVE